MDQVADALRQHEGLALAWRLVAWGFAAYLLGLGLLAFVRPALLMRFFEGHVVSWRANLVEAGLRLLAGLTFMGVSPETRLPAVFFWFGAVLAATAILMAFLYGLHRRYADWAIPFARRTLPLIGLSAFALGALIVWALS